VHKSCGNWERKEPSSLASRQEKRGDIDIDRKRLMESRTKDIKVEMESDSEAGRYGSWEKVTRQGVRIRKQNLHHRRE